MLFTLFITTFITIFIAEIGDKTQIATLTLSGSSNQPRAVFLASSLALVSSSLIAVLAGGSISQFIPDLFITSISALGFIVIGVLILLSNDNNDP